MWSDDAGMVVDATALLRWQGFGIYYLGVGLIAEVRPAARNASCT